MKANFEESVFSELIKKYSPIAGLVVITLLLMLYFKESKDEIGDFINKGTSNLASFYTQNLKPIFFKTDITNEDVMNFALHSNIPIDKEQKKVLQIGYDENTDNEFFEIKPVAFKEDTKNYESFVEYLNLDDDKKNMLDSILSDYKVELYSSVLYNEDSTLAVNPNLPLLRDAIMADLMSFAENANSEVTKKMLPIDQNYNDPEIKNAVNEIKTLNHDKIKSYIIFTPDSVFEEKCIVDEKKFEEQLAKYEGKIAEMRNEMKEFRFDIKVSEEVKESIASSESHSKMHVEKSKDWLKVSLPKINEKRMKKLEEVEKLKKDVKVLTKFMANLNIEVNDENFKMKMKDLGKDKMKMEFEVNVGNIDSIIKTSLKALENINLNNLDHLEHLNDSLTELKKEKIREELRRK